MIFRFKGKRYRLNTAILKASFGGLAFFIGIAAFNTWFLLSWILNS